MHDQLALAAAMAVLPQVDALPAAKAELAFEEFEECAAGGRDVIDLLGDAELVDGCDCIAAAGDAVCRRLCYGARQRLGAFGERVVLEHAERSVPDDRARLLERARQLVG